MEVNPAEATWVGIDIGTQSVRVVLVAGNGTVLALRSAPLDSTRSQGGRVHEQDPYQWWHAVGAASRQAVAALPAAAAGKAIGGLAICSTSGTIAVTDDGGTPLGPALMYDDARAVDDLARLHGWSATVPGSSKVQLSWALPKIAWLVRYEAILGACRPRIAHSADFVAASLVGHPVHTDTSHALKSGYDVVNDRWDNALIDAAGVDPDVLPEVVSPGTQLGTMTADAAAHMGIPAGTPVVAGMTDGCAAQIAAGALTAGSWNSVLGTTLVLKGVSEQLVDDPEGAVYSHRHPDRGWLPGGASNVGAGALTAEFADADFDQLSAEAQAHEPATSVIYPLTAGGERFPFVRPDAARFELGRDGRPAQRYAALLQGVAFTERLCFERLAAIGADVSGEIAVTGGATRNGYWNQLRADVLGRSLVLPAAPEPAFGMAVLASAQGSSVTERVARMVSRRSVVDPRPGMHDRLSSGYVRFFAELVKRGYIRDGFATSIVGSAS